VMNCKIATFMRTCKYNLSKMKFLFCLSVFERKIETFVLARQKEILKYFTKHKHHKREMFTKCKIITQATELHGEFNGF